MTPALGLLLTTCILAAAPAKDEDPLQRAQATLQRVSKLPPERQRIWLRLIEQRYGWAVLLTLKPEDAKREQARAAKIVRQKTVAWNVLLDLLRQLDQREKAAIARLVRQYRAEVYKTFHERPRNLVDRQEAWYRIWSLWQKAGSPPEQQDRLMDWLAEAIKVSGKDSIGPLPADPIFGDDVPLVPEQLVKQLTHPPAAKSPASKPAAGTAEETKPAAPRQPPDDFLPGPELQARWPLLLRVPDPRRAIGPAKQPSEAVVLRRAENFESLSLLAEAPPAKVPPLHVLPPIVAGDPKDLTTRPAPRHAVVVAVKRKALTAAESSAEVVVRAGPGDAKPQTVSPQRQASELPPRTVEPPLPEQPAVGPSPVAAWPRAISLSERGAIAAEPLPGPTLHRDLVAELPRELAEFAVPKPQPLAEYRVQRKPLGLDGPDARLDQHAQVNVEELGTRIEGINLSLRNLEAELNEKRDFTADQLDSLLSRLDILVLRQKDLTLFRNLIASREQARVGQIDSSAPSSPPWAPALPNCGPASAKTRPCLRTSVPPR